MSYAQTDTLWEEEPLISDEPMEIPEIEPDTGERVFEFFAVEKRAQFPGGEAALMQFVARNYRIPPIALESSSGGTIYVQFVIDTTGNVTDVSIVEQGKRLGYGLEEEAIRVVKSMPKWSPAVQRGTKVKMRFRLPVRVAFQ